MSDILTVPKGSWHHKMYRYWADRWSASEYPPHPARQENLCHYMRVVFIWSPLFWSFTKGILFWWAVPAIWALMLGGLGGTVYGLIVSPALVGYAYALVGTAVGLLVGTFGLVSSMYYCYGKIKDPNRLTTLKLCMAYISAKKHKICPFIRFDDE